jgi:hypothetical protein
MKRVTLWLAVTLATFTLGVTITALHTLRTHSNKPIPSTIEHDRPASRAVPSCFPGLSRSVENLNPTSYFPSGAFYPKAQHEKFIVDWYTKHLQAMAESSLLYEADSRPETYRFLWLRSFHHPVAVRVWASNDGHFINVKQTNGAGGYEPGTLITDQTRRLTDTEWDHFITLLERSCYWQLSAENDEMGNDGARWILEGVRERRYHVVDRWSPQSGAFREACLYLLNLSNPALTLSDQTTY